MTNPPDTASKPTTAMPAGTEAAEPIRPETQEWVTPLARTTKAPEPVQAWRSWLGEDPAAEDGTDPDSEGDTESISPTASAFVPDDDPMAPIVSEMYARRAARRHRLTRRVMIGSAAAVLAAAAGVGTLVATSNGRTSAAGVTPAAPHPSMTTEAVVTPVPPAWCHSVNTANLIVSDAAGDQVTGPGVILAQQFSLYVRRDVAGVRAALAPGASAASEDATRQAIDATPVGTQHCVTIRPDGPDRWAVQISEKRPDGSTPEWSQTVTTATQANGRVLITAITAGGA